MGVRRTHAITASLLLRRMRRDSRKGSAAIEFAMIAPVFFLLIFAIIETGVLFLAGNVLQFAADDAARLVRTGQAQTEHLTATQFRDKICADIAPVMQCGSDLQVDVRSFSDFAAANFPAPLNKNGELDPDLNKFEPGSAGDVVLLRTFYTWDVMTPLLAPFLTNMSGDKRLLSATAAFRNEPF